MKKSLYLTSALVAASVLALGSTDSMAAGKALKVAVSGSYKAVVGYAKQGSGFVVESGTGTGYTGYNTIDVKTDSEVYFKASGATDSGIKVGVGIELESDQASAATPIDGTYMTLGGGFGTFLLGAGGAAAAALAVNAPSTGAIGIFGGDSSTWVVKPTNVAVSPVVGANIGGNDKAKIRWVSPSFSGFTAGASYVPDLSSADNAMPSNGGNGGTDASQVDVALKYSGKMGANAVSGSFGWWSVDQTTTAANANTSTEGYSLGASTTMGAFTVGVGYKEIDSTGNRLSGTSVVGMSGSANSKDEEVVNVGVSWAQGKTTLALNYFSAEMPLATATEGEDSLTKWTVGAKYGMGPGIDFVGTVQNIVWSDEGAAATDNNKGTAFVGGVAVKF
jgi:outer membrane protein OmpU